MEDINIVLARKRDWRKSEKAKFDRRAQKGSVKDRQAKVDEKRGHLRVRMPWWKELGHTIMIFLGDE